MQVSRAAKTRKRTRIQAEKEDLILEAALDVFSRHGFRGTTIDMIAKKTGLSKPNLLYYFNTKEAMHRRLLDRTLENWLEPLIEIAEDGDPLDEIKSYIKRKLELARDFPRESRLFASEILQGAPRIQAELQDLHRLVDEKASVISGWAKSGRLAECDPHHLIFSIWSTTQHYADFDPQVRIVLGNSDKIENRFEDAERFLNQLFVEGLRPKP